MISLIDSHCHLNSLDLTLFDGELDNVIQAAKDKQVDYLLNVAIEWEDNSILKNISSQYEHVYHSVGVHPNHREGHDPSVEELVQAAAVHQCVAIGETGLDYYRTEGDVGWQQERFRRHISAAKEIDKPLIIHTRQAREDTIAILQEENAKDVGGVLHCFTETWEMAKQGMDLGFYVSFSGIVTFKNATELQEVARKMPLDRILIETDSPYLAPMPFRGKPNQPAYVKHVAEFLAELRGASLESIAEATADNFWSLFGSKPNVDA